MMRDLGNLNGRHKGESSNSRVLRGMKCGWIVALTSRAPVTAIWNQSRLSQASFVRLCIKHPALLGVTGRVWDGIILGCPTPYRWTGIQHEGSHPCTIMNPSRACFLGTSQEMMWWILQRSLCTTGSGSKLDQCLTAFTGTAPSSLWFDNMNSYPLPR
jgi:hypothetical protein